MNLPENLEKLLEGQPPSLAAWMAEPVSVADARTTLEQIRRQIGSGQPPSFAAQLGEMVLRYWSGQDIESTYRNLSALLDDRAQQAMLELCFGQLLVARKRHGASDQLDKGFRLAAHLLEPEDYFVVLKRHQLLRQLPASNGGESAAGLDALLREARVIERLKGDGTRPAGTSQRHRDTLD